MSTAPGGEQPPQPVLPPAAEMAAALAAQPAPAPAAADGTGTTSIDTIAAEIRAGLRPHTQFMEEEDVGGREFSREAARATGSLNALAALPEQHLQVIFSRAGVSVLRCAAAPPRGAQQDPVQVGRDRGGDRHATNGVGGRDPVEADQEQERPSAFSAAGGRRAAVQEAKKE